MLPVPVVGVDEREHRRADQRLGACDPAISAKRALTSVMRPSRSMWATPAAACVTMVRNIASDSRSASLTRRRSLMSTKVRTTPLIRSSPLRYGRSRASSQRSPKRTSRSIGTRLLEHRARVGVELRVVEAVGEVADRPADVGVDQVEELDRRRREERDAQAPVEEDGGDRRRRHQVLQVAVGAAELVDLDLELLVDGGQLLVDRLQLLAAGLELLGRRAQLLVHRLQLFVARLQLLRGDRALLGGVAQVPLELVDLLLQAVHVGVFVRRRRRRARRDSSSASGHERDEQEAGGEVVGAADADSAPKLASAPLRRTGSAPSRPPSSLSRARSSAVRRSPVSAGSTASSRLLVGSPPPWRR